MSNIAINYVPMNENLKLITWNATSVMSSCTYIVDMLKLNHFDILGISEHWLRDVDLHFLDQLDSNYKRYAV